jgi:uroporphyrinogen-III synthase
MPRPTLTAPPPLLLTRPAAASARFAEAWRQVAGADAPVVIAPVVEIVAAPGAADPGRYAGVVFASENAVVAVGAAPRRMVAWCVGDRTAEAAAAAGYDARSAAGDAGALVALIAAEGGGPLLFARGEESRGDVAARLRAAGLPCDEAVVYAQRDAPLTAEARALLAGTRPVLVPLFSANSARRLAREMATGPSSAPLLLAALAPAVATAWDGPEARRIAVAARPDATAMIEALRTLAALP